MQSIEQWIDNDWTKQVHDCRSWFNRRPLWGAEAWKLNIDKTYINNVLCARYAALVELGILDWLFNEQSLADLANEGMQHSSGFFPN
jgi:hypothetical protein